MWPDVACNSLWLDDAEAAAQRGRSGQPKKWMAEDWRGDIEIVPRLPLDGPPSTHRCLVWCYYEEACDMQVSQSEAASLTQCEVLVCLPAKCVDRKHPHLASYVAHCTASPD